MDHLEYFQLTASSPQELRSIVADYFLDHDLGIIPEAIRTGVSEISIIDMQDVFDNYSWLDESGGAGGFTYNFGEDICYHNGDGFMTRGTSIGCGNGSGKGEG